MEYQQELRELKNKLQQITLFLKSEASAPASNLPKEYNIIKIQGKIEFYFYNEFTDLFDLRELDSGTSSVEGVSEGDLNLTDLYGDRYNFTDKWQVDYYSEIKVDRGNSKYFHELE